ncbi:hypothetical protein [Alteromonas lipolytica]|uniref:Phytase-like domain-containing protein n=1 Tax=Alteromonas lipolytica TaxID=1856405 RepID=A0A1E8FC75_9ALTE|nr:hypothetical protein [Alteromonas lipolytica]OFI33521.1 hypothetical protein BFC17_04490 [Alteromonas lipolytica]GGF58937.1 hypothetical protein GCM10011338_09020 [Alteromonas lipolytica]
MKSAWLLSVVTLGLLSACGDNPQPSAEQKNAVAPEELVVAGTWISEAAGGVMVDPQTSGLTQVNGKLYTISDGSAKDFQRRRLHQIDPASATLAPRPDAMNMASRVRRSCFSQYLADEPDLEALVADPDEPGVFYTVTEDATRTGALSDRCQQRYEATGSTDYPTLLVRIQQHTDGSATMTHVRPLQFPLEYAVGDFPNDGIEGMALGQNRTLYIALERDNIGNPRIFSVNLDATFWDSSEFAVVTEPELAVPSFEGGRHPINGLEYYQPAGATSGFLLAAARNDNELWIIDAAGQRPTQKIAMQFTAPGGDSENCAAQEIMDNASIEGLAVIDSTLWMINDPWKVNYMKNLQCEASKARYEAMAPLLFSTPLQADWFK